MTDREAKIYKNADSINAKKQLARTNGTKWTSLHRLPYFDASKFTVVEPMHNLYLGTLKHLVPLMANDDGIDKESLKKMKKFYRKRHLYQPRIPHRRNTQKD